jgi:hypothetical protein
MSLLLSSCLETVEKAIACESPCVLNIKITPMGPIPAIVQAKH